MPAYAIIRSASVRGRTHYTVALRSDDGSVEIQEYEGDTTTLEVATRNYNTQKLTPPPDLRNPPLDTLNFIEVR